MNIYTNAQHKNPGKKEEKRQNFEMNMQKSESMST